MGLCHFSLPSSWPFLMPHFHRWPIRSAAGREKLNLFGAHVGGNRNKTKNKKNISQTRLPLSHSFRHWHLGKRVADTKMGNSKTPNSRQVTLAFFACQISVPFCGSRFDPAILVAPGSKKGPYVRRHARRRRSVRWWPGNHGKARTVAAGDNCKL